MVDYTRQVQGASNPSVNRTVFQKQDGVGATIGKMIAPVVAGEAIRGYANKQQSEDLQQALGNNETQEQIAQGVKQAQQSLGGIGELDSASYQKMGQAYAEKVGASARTVSAMAEKGLVSNIYAEAYARKKISQVASNPFYAAFQDVATDLAGPVAGGSSRSVDNLLAGSPELAELQARAEGERKAVEEYEKTVSGISLKTGLPSDVVKTQLRERANFEETQRQEGLSVTQKFNNQITRDFYNFQESLVGSLDQDGKVPADSYHSIGQMIAQQKASAVTAINASNITEAEKRDKLAVLDKQYEGMSAMLEASNRAGFQKGLLDEKKVNTELLVSKHAPIWYALKTAGADDKTLNYFLYMTPEQRKQEFASRYGQGLLDDLDSSAVNFANFVGDPAGRSKDGTAKFKPDPLVGEGLANPAMAEQVKEIEERGEGDVFNAKLHQQAYKQPAATLRGVNKGPLLKQAQQGDVASQKAVATTLNAVVGQVRAERDSLSEVYENAAGGEAIYVSVQPIRGGRQSIKKIHIPDTLHGREEELQQVYQSLRSSPWAWPEGVDNAEDAFYEIMNGSAKIVPSDNNLRPEGSGLTSPGKSKTQRGKAGETEGTGITLTSMTGGQREGSLQERLPRLGGQEASVSPIRSEKPSETLSSGGEGGSTGEGIKSPPEATEDLSQETADRYKNNNPGNVQKLSRDTWEGQAEGGYGEGGRFASFKTPEHGVRAMARDMKTKIGRGVDTIEKIIKVYAPEEENDTSSYIKSVASQMGISPSETLDNSDIKDLVVAIIRHENKADVFDYYTPEVIRKGVKMALDK